ncbi:PH domain-containing protein [Haloarcula litorea]|uniref:PH domain-containing protein n=1 Tax=Haloarcula litorea TaxID=3032579 RepID=UPI0023E82EB2|nr:PH domain-containing protein [Halomicroarcula sp. GDY20]
MSATDGVPVDGERVVWAGQPRRRVVLQGLAAGLPLGLIVGLVAALVATGSPLPTAAVVAAGGLLTLVAVALPVVGVWLWRRTTGYVLTERALYHRTGLLRVTVTELPLRHVQNTSFSQGVLGTLFDHGTVAVDTAGSAGAELRLRALDDPAAVHRRIAERAASVRGDRDDDLPGTPEQWRAVLDEVRGLRRSLAGE